MPITSRAIQTITTLGIGFLAILPGCSSDGDSEVRTSTIERACDVICGKVDTCGLLFGQTRAQCVTNCRETDGSPADSSCRISDSEANACIDAVNNAQCTAFTTGMITECDFCPTDTDGGVPIRTDGGIPSFDAGAGAGCTDLRACCTQLAPQDQAGCNSAADQGNDAACAAALAVFQAAQLCT